jgi:cholestenol delta-isomerase
MASLIPAMKNESNLLITDHPYYPLEVEIASYLANEWSVPVLLGIFAVMWVVVIFGTRGFVNARHPNMPLSEKLAIWWFVLCELFSFFCLPQKIALIGGALGNW